MNISDNILGVILGGIIGFFSTILVMLTTYYTERKKGSDENLKNIKSLIFKRIQSDDVINLVKKYRRKRKWSFWKKKRLIDLSYTNLKNLDFRHANFTYVMFYNSNLKKSDLYGANLSFSDFSKTSMNDVDLSGCIVRNSKFYKSVLDDAKIISSNMANSDFSRASFKNADLKKSNFTDTILKGADFTNANCDKIDLTRADLRGAIISENQLKQAKSITDCKMSTDTK